MSLLEPTYLKEETFKLFSEERAEPSTHPPKILILCGSLRPKSFSRHLADEAGRILKFMGAEVRRFDSRELPLFDQESHDHLKVKELRDLSLWSEGQEFEDDGAMKASSYRDRVVDVLEELMRLTYLTRDCREFLIDRYSERKEQKLKLDLKKS